MKAFKNKSEDFKLNTSPYRQPVETTEYWSYVLKYMMFVHIHKHKTFQIRRVNMYKSTHLILTDVDGKSGKINIWWAKSGLHQHAEEAISLQRKSKKTIIAVKYFQFKWWGWKEWI